MSRAVGSSGGRPPASGGVRRLLVAAAAALVTAACGASVATTVSVSGEARARSVPGATAETGGRGSDGGAEAGGPDIEAAPDGPLRGVAGGSDGPSDGDRPVRVLVVGDSNAVLLGIGLVEWAADQGLADVTLAGRSGCGIGRGGRRLGDDGRPKPIPPECADWPERWAAAVSASLPDVVLVVNGAWEVTDRQLEDDDVWRTVGDPTYDRFLTAEFDEAIELLSAEGAHIVWPTYPALARGTLDGVPPAVAAPMSDPARLDRLDALVAGLAERHPELTTIDLSGWLASAWPGGELDPTYRPDGVHFNAAGAAEVAQWLGPALLAELGNR